jgi:hypothetical protein
MDRIMKKHLENTTEPSLRKISKYLRALSLRDDTDHIILVKRGCGLDDSIEDILKALKALGKTAIVMIVDDMDDLSLLNRARMAAHGWFRIDDIKKVRTTIAEAKHEPETARIN